LFRSIPGAFGKTANPADGVCFVPQEPVREQRVPEPHAVVRVAPSPHAVEELALPLPLVAQLLPVAPLPHVVR